MKLDVIMTRKEFEGAVLRTLNVYGKAEIDSIYMRADGGLECTVRTIEEPSAPVHSSRSCSPTDDSMAAPDRMELWTPDPPPFIRTVEAAPPEPEARPWKEIDSDWWPPLPLAVNATKKLVAVECACKTYGVYAEHGWVASGNLHTKEHCEGVEMEAAPPAINDAAALSASSTGEHGTVESADEDRIPF